MTRRPAVVGGAAVLLAVVLVVAGRWEEHRSARDELRQMRAVLAAVGDIQRRRPTGYRTGPPACLAYATPGNAYGLQLCFDSSGRLVETVDRRPLRPRYASLAYDPSLSTISFPPLLLKRLFSLSRVPEQ
jgi:hypothetical protein